MTNNEIIDEYLAQCGYEYVEDCVIGGGNLAVYHNWRKTIVVITKSNGEKMLLKEVDVSELV